MAKITLRTFAFTAVLIPLVSVAGLAWAGPLFQPNNTPIPQGNSLQNNGFDPLNDPVNAINDAEIMPPRFIPSCVVSFTVHLRNAGYQNSFGWYNANGVAPAFEDLHQILDCNEPVGTNKDVDILGDPAYEGGEIGFFQAVGGCADVDNPASVIHVLYSETEWNPDSNLMNQLIHLLIYKSAINPRTYYFAWEDLLQGGDNDFEDLFTSVEGIDCVGDGPACEIIASPGDNDGDLVCGGDDNCPMNQNPDQADADNDMIGDACDPCPDDPDLACMGETGDGDGDGDVTGDGDGEPTTGDGDGDGDVTGDGDGEPTTGDGDGDPTAGDGDGDPTAGDGDGDPTAGDGDGDPTAGDGDGDPTGEGDGNSGDDEGDDNADDGTAGESGDSGSASSAGLDEDDGCNCATEPTRGGGLGFASLFGLIALGLRRRRN